MKKNKSGYDPYELYIILCKDGSYYTGIAKDAEKRYKKHFEGKGAKIYPNENPA